ncbi:MAG: glycosyltransferase [Burkholderiales bacterium]
MLRHYQCHLVHIPHLFWTPLYLPCPYVITVHDLLDFMYRTHNGSGIRRVVNRYLTHRVLSHAARILAVSQFTKMDIQRLFNIPENQIEVVYNAIDERFRVACPQALAQTLQPHGIGREFHCTFNVLVFA